jgi:hypothetical protein
MGNKIIENEFLTLTIENNIILGVYKVNSQIDINAAKLCIQDRILLSNNKIYPTLVDTRNIKFINKEARDYFASNEGVKLLSAAAILVDSFFSKILVQIFITYSKPSIPTKMFSKKDEALKWLKQFAEK